jgi:hypothetical protein
MSHIIQHFGDWKKVNEDNTPGRERQRGDNNNKVVAIPVDKSTLKLKIVNDADVIDGNGKLTIDGFDALLTWIQSQGEIINYYSALKDLTNNIVVYEIGKDNDRKQVVIFKIYNKNALKMQDPSKPGINSQVRFVSASELNQALGGAILNTKAVANIVSGQTKGSTATGFKLPYPIASMLDSSDPKVISFVITAYNKVLTDPRAKMAPILVKVRAETGARKLGPASQLFVKALNAGFAIQDNEYAGEIEMDEITQILVDKISYTAESRGFYLDLSATRIVESESEVIRGFDVDVFLSASKNVPGVTTTGDIKVPEEGFKYGIKGDTEFAKFQQLMLTNLPIYQGGALKAKAPIAAFLKTKADGIYGDKTKNMISYLKIGLSDPKYPDNDAATIKPDFVNRMMKEFKLVKEARTYLGLDGATVIMEGFDTGAADAATGGSTVVNRGTQNRDTAVISKDILEHPAKPGWQYTTKDNIWYTRKGPKDKWWILASPSSIKDMIQLYGKRGYYIKLKNEGGGKFSVAENPMRKYRFANNQWEVFINGGWVKDPSPLLLNQAYGDKPVATGAPGKTSTPAASTTSVKQIDDSHKAIANTIKGWFDNEETFAEFKSSGWATTFSAGIVNDSEYEAWKEFERLWATGENSVKKKLASTQAAIDKLPKGSSSKERCQKNQTLLAGIITKDGKFHNKFKGGTSDDNFTITLYQAEGAPFRKVIDTDF